MSKTDKIFHLESMESIKQAERFKHRLENEGYKVITKPYGFHGVRIMTNPHRKLIKVV